MQPYISIDTYYLACVLFDVSIDLNGLEQWKESGYPHLTVQLKTIETLLMQID